MQFLGFWGSAAAAGRSRLGWRAAVIMVLTLVASAHLADATEAGTKFAAVTVDARNGKLLYSENVDAIRHPASLTKMMTLYLLFEDLKAGKIKLDSPIRISARATSMAPSKLGAQAGSTITVETAIKALVVKSANDVACAVAENLGGTEQAFAQRMTRTARSIGMSRSNFANASGLPNPAQVTTARDMATLGLRLMRDFPQYYPYFRIQAFTYNGRTINGHNRLLGKFEGTDGIKTGYIAASGFNLVTSVKRGDKRLVGVVLGGKSGASRDAYMKKMLSQYFDDAKGGKTIAAMAGSSKGAINPVGSDDQDEVASTQVADAMDQQPAAPAEPAPLPAKDKKKKQASTGKKPAPQPEPQIAAADDNAPSDQGDTDEDQAEGQQQQPNEADLAASTQQAPAPQGSTIQQVEAVPSPQPQQAEQPQQPQQPQVVESKIIDPAAPAKLPFQVKTPAEQLADQATVASLASPAADTSWMIHIGEFATKQDAQARLQDLRRKTPSVLQGKTAQTVAVEKNGAITYRARFTGFDQDGANAACKAIKKKKSVCQVQAPG